MIIQRLSSLLAVLALSFLSLVVQAAEPAAAPDPTVAFKTVDLKALVPQSRMDPGQRAIFNPVRVRFTARLAAPPQAQKTAYLDKALDMLQISAKPKVSQRIGLDYGGEKLLAAYVEEGAAARIAKELKVGDSRDFYAYHVYNNQYGPALVVISFGQ